MEGSRLGSANAAAVSSFSNTKTRAPRRPPLDALCVPPTPTPPIHPLTPAPHRPRDAMCTQQTGGSRRGLFWVLGLGSSGVRTKRSVLAAGPPLHSRTPHPASLSPPSSPLLRSMTHPHGSPKAPCYRGRWPGWGVVPGAAVERPREGRLLALVVGAD